MNEFIAICGLDCAVCDARIATMTNDNALRETTAAKWRLQYNAPAITAQSINCTGCREPGVKIGHCTECEIRNCAIAKSCQTCAECSTFEKCPTLEQFIKFVPAALENLRPLRS